MDTPDIRIALIAERQHSVFTRDQAFRCGFTRRQVDGRVQRGIWLVLHRGVYGIRGSVVTFEGKVLAAVLACGRMAAASHRTAGQLWHLEGIRSGRTEISLRGRGRTSAKGLIVHVPRTLGPKDVTKIGPIPITTPARTLMDLAAVVEALHMEDALDDALRRDLVTAKGLLQRLDPSAHGRRGLPYLEKLVRERIGMPVSESRLESDVRRMFRDAGLPLPVMQHEIRDKNGSLVARVDFAYPHVRLAIEVDGYAYHSSRSQWESDRNRQNRLVSLGWVPLRVTAQQIKSRPQDVIGLVWRHLTTLEGVNARQI